MGIIISNHLSKGANVDSTFFSCISKGLFPGNFPNKSMKVQKKNIPIHVDKIKLNLYNRKSQQVSRYAGVVQW